MGVNPFFRGTIRRACERRFSSPGDRDRNRQYPDRSISDSDFLENEINSESVTEQAGVDGCELASGFITGIGHGPAGDPGVDEITEGRTDGFGFDEEG